MGYYSTLTEIDSQVTKINEEALQKVNEFLENEKTDYEPIQKILRLCKKRVYETIPHGFYKAKIEWDGKYLSIYPEETTAKFYDTELMGLLLALIIEKGYVMMHFTGEDGTRWAIKAVPDGIDIFDEPEIRYRKTESCRII